MEILDRALLTTQNGVGRCVLLAGEGGIGKSRLACYLSNKRGRLGACTAEPSTNGLIGKILYYAHSIPSSGWRLCKEKLRPNEYGRLAVYNITTMRVGYSLCKLQIQEFPEFLPYR